MERCLLRSASNHHSAVASADVCLQLVQTKEAYNGSEPICSHRRVAIQHRKHSRGNYSPRLGQDHTGKVRFVIRANEKLCCPHLAVERDLKLDANGTDTSALSVLRFRHHHLRGI